MSGSLGLGLGLLLALVFASYSKLKGLDKQLHWVAAGGLFFLIDAALTDGLGTLLQGAAGPLSQLFTGLGALFVLVGALWASGKLLKV